MVARVVSQVPSPHVRCNLPWPAGLCRPAAKGGCWEGGLGGGIWGKTRHRGGKKDGREKDRLPVGFTGGNYLVKKLRQPVNPEGRLPCINICFFITLELKIKVRPVGIYAFV